MSNDAILKALTAITTTLTEVQQRLDALERVCRNDLDAQVRLDDAGKDVYDRHAEAIVPPPTSRGLICGATDSSVDAVCGLPFNHPGRFHREDRDGEMWAEWSGDDRAD